MPPKLIPVFSPPEKGFMSLTQAQLQVVSYVQNPATTVRGWGFFKPLYTIWFGPFRLDWKDGDWHFTPGDWVYSFGETDLNNPMMTIVLDHLERDYVRKRCLMYTLPKAREFELDGHELSYTHMTPSLQGVENQFRLQLSKTTMTVFDGQVSRLDEKVGDVIEHHVTQVRRSIFVGKYDVDPNNAEHSLMRGERYTLTDGKYEYYSGALINNIKHGKGIEFIVQGQSTEWLEGVWEVGYRHGDFIKRELEKVTYLEYSKGKQVGVRHSYYTNGLQSLSQTVEEEGKSYIYNLTFHPKSEQLFATYEGEDEVEDVGLSIFVILLQKNLIELREKGYDAIPLAHMKTLCRESVKAGWPQLPIDYFGRETGKLTQATSTYSLFAKAWDEIQVERFITEVLDNLGGFNRNPLTEALQVLKKLLNHSISIREIAAFSNRYTMFIFSTPRSQEQTSEAVKGFKAQLLQAFPWMLLRLEFLYELLAEGENAASAHQILDRLKALAVEIKQIEQQETFEKERTALEREHDETCSIVEHEFKTSFTQLVASMNEVVDDQKGIDRRTREALMQRQRQQQKAFEKVSTELFRQEKHQRESIEEEFRRDDTLVEGALNVNEVRCLDLVRQHQKLEEKEALLRHTLMTEEPFLRANLMQSFHAEKQQQEALDKAIRQVQQRAALIQQLEKGEVDAREMLKETEQYPRELLTQSFFTEKPKLLALSVARLACHLTDATEQRGTGQKLVEDKRITRSDLSLSKSITRQCLTAENLLEQIHTKAGIKPSESLNILFLMIVQLSIAKGVSLVDASYSTERTESELKEARGAFDLAFKTAGLSRKDQWWGCLQKSAERYLTLSFPDAFPVQPARAAYHGL